MNSTTQQEPVPDFGEPWKLDSYNSPLGDTGDFEGVLQIYTREHQELVAENWNPEDEHEELFSRIITCVNACQGMSNPTAEIQAMREAISWLPKLIGHGHTDDCLFLNRANAPCDCGIDEAESILAKLRPFIK